LQDASLRKPSSSGTAIRSIFLPAQSTWPEASFAPIRHSVTGLQFHVEMTPELMAEWFAEPELHSDIGNLSYIDPEAIPADAPKRFPLMDALCQRLLSRFAALCR
jgi:hypothetical protein